LEFEYDAAAFEIMANDFAEETEGANTSEAVFAIKLAQFVDPKLYKRWRANQGTEEAVPVSEMMPTAITLSEVELQWSEETKAFYSIGQIGIANIFKTDLDVRIDAHIEIPKREGNNLMYIHLENSKGTWYYLIYDDGDISILSNNTDFNNVVLAKASKSKVKLMKDSDENPGEPAFIFLDNMNQRYLGGEYPPKRKLPEEEKKKKKEEEPEKKDGF
jgi:hypothetical protein